MGFRAHGSRTNPLPLALFAITISCHHKAAKEFPFSSVASTTSVDAVSCSVAVSVSASDGAGSTALLDAASAGLFSTACFGSDFSSTCVAFG